jgi:tripartite-type tricarboxylate transporter receptor subunit TctC
MSRVAMLPDVPTIAETVPGYAVTGWVGIGAPKGTPEEIVQRLNREINAIVRTPDFASKAQTQGADVLGGTPTEMGALMRADLAKWGKLTAKLKLQIE